MRISTQDFNISLWFMLMMVVRRLEVNAYKTKYMVMSRDQSVGRSLNIKTDNSSFERVEEFKYLGTTLKKTPWP